MILTIKNRPKKGEKTACVVRYGAWGDAVMTTPVLKALKESGYHVTLNCTEKCWDVLCSDPNIDAWLVQASGEIPPEKLDEEWKKITPKFDKFINLSGSIENKLLFAPYQDEYWLSKEERQKLANKNYYDHTMELAGFPERKGERGQLFFSKNEENFAKKARKRWAGFFIVWCLSGSSIHKIYPHADAVIQAIIKGLPDAHVILVGEAGAKGIIEPHPRIIDKCGDFGIRESFVLTKYADLVITTETGVLAAAGCFDTPKIALLSHGSEENVTKYYKNCTVVRENVSCAPCHKLHYNKETCPLDKEMQLPICMGLLHPKKLLPPIEQVYMNWKNKNLNGD